MGGASGGSDKVLKDLREAVLRCDPDGTVKAAKAAVKEGVDPLTAIEKGLAPAIKEVGERFERMEVYLPELMLAGEAMKSALKLLLPLIPKQKKVSRATVVIGTVQGDVHEIGKNIVASLLMANGFEVVDLGVDVKTQAFVEEAKRSNARIIGASALMSSTIGSQKDIIDYLSATGSRKKHAVLIGGGPTTEEWRKEICADGWGRTAVDGVKLAGKFSR